MTLNQVCGMWYTIEDNLIKLIVIAKPNAKKSRLIKLSAEGLQISLQAKPQEGEANKALVLFLATLFQTPKTHVKLIAGLQSRYKRVSIPVNAKSLGCLQRLQDDMANKQLI